MVVSLALTPLFYGGPPAITEFRPSGAQKGGHSSSSWPVLIWARVPLVVSALPATFTAVGSEKPEMVGRSAAFLVEPTGASECGRVPHSDESSLTEFQIFYSSHRSISRINGGRIETGIAPASERQRGTSSDDPVHRTDLNGHSRPGARCLRFTSTPASVVCLKSEARRCGSGIDPVIRVLDVRVSSSLARRRSGVEPRLARRDDVSEGRLLLRRSPRCAVLHAAAGLLSIEDRIL